MLVVPDLTSTFSTREIKNDSGLVEAESLDAGEREITKFDGPPLFVRAVLTPLGKNFETVLPGLKKDAVSAVVGVEVFHRDLRLGTMRPRSGIVRMPA